MKARDRVSVGFVQQQSIASQEIQLRHEVMEDDLFTNLIWEQNEEFRTVLKWFFWVLIAMLIGLVM